MSKTKHSENEELKGTWKCDKKHSWKKSCLTGWTMVKDWKLPQSENNDILISHS